MRAKTKRPFLASPIFRVLFSFWAFSYSTQVVSDDIPEGEAPLSKEEKPTEEKSPSFSIEKIPGWTSQENLGGIRLLMTDDANKGLTPEPAVGEFTFKRNVSLVVRAGGRPIDEETGEEFKKELGKILINDGRTEGLRLGEMKLIEGKQPGIMVLAYFDMNGAPLTQVHVLFSDASSHYHLTYTDLSSQFEKEESAYTLAWNSIMSFKTDSPAPSRYGSIFLVLGCLMGCFALLGLVQFLRRRAQRKAIDFADELEHYESMAPRSKFGVSVATKMDWNLDKPVSQVSHF